MRYFIIILAALSTSWGTPGAAFAEQPNNCKQCSDQRRTCTSNYSAKTCQTEYDRCIRECQRK
jgi:hypothetical protein